MIIWYASAATAAVVAIACALVAQRRALADPQLERIRAAEKAVWESVRYIDERGIEIGSQAAVSERKK
jgi:hypothetical protein